MTDRTDEQRRKVREQVARWRAANPERQRQINRKSVANWQARNPDKARQTQKRWRDARRAQNDA